MTLNGAPLVSVAPGSIILPDTTRAFAILADCKAEPLITLPLEQNPNTGTTIAGGSGPRNPVRVVPGQSENVQPASFAAALYPTPAVAMRGITVLAGIALSSTPPGWLLLGTVAAYTGAITYTVWDTKQAAGPSAQAIGDIVVEAPNGQTYKEYISRPLGKNAEALSKITRIINGSPKNPGSCSDEQFNKLDKEKDYLCGQKSSCSSSEELTKPEILNRIKNAQACIDKRIEIMDTCFDGGDENHRDQVRQRLSGMQSCINLLTP